MSGEEKRKRNTSSSNQYSSMADENMSSEIPKDLIGMFQFSLLFKDLGFLFLLSCSSSFYSHSQSLINPAVDTKPNSNTLRLPLFSCYSCYFSWKSWIDGISDLGRVPQRSTSLLTRDSGRTIWIADPRVLKKQAGLKLHDYSIFVNVVSGVSLTETSGDLAVAAAICSSYLEFPIPNNVAFIGEIGLGGELRMVPRMEKRVQTVAKLGYETCVVPKSAEKSLAALNIEGLRIVPCRNLKEVIDSVFRKESVNL